MGLTRLLRSVDDDRGSGSAACPAPASVGLHSARVLQGRQKSEKFQLDLFWSIAAVMAAVGVLGLFKSLVLLLGVWVGDPLRSIGIVIPPVSVFSILRAWKRSGWERRGSWWGLP